jgi:peptide chain release factor 1
MIDRSYIHKVEHRISDIESELSNPETASNQPLFRALMGEHAHLKKMQVNANAYYALLDQQQEAQQILADSSADDELCEMAEMQLAEAEQKLPEAEKKLMVSLLPPRPEDRRNVIMEIRAGTGGEEAALFAGDLFRMYTRFAEGRGWKTSVIDANPSAIGGYKEVIFTVEGTDVYHTMRYESGVHRVQRIPATEAGGRIHTSAATVAVMPEADELDDIEIKTEDLRIDVYRSSGAGGQHVNTTDSAVRITHLPTGIVVQSQDERSQHRNKEIAMHVLKTRLLDEQKQAEQAKTADQRRSMVGSGDRSERIRTYNFPQNRVTDHRINLTLYSLDKIIMGDLGELVGALSQSDVEERLDKEISQA